MRFKGLFASLAALAAAACSNVEQAREPVIGRLSWFAQLEGRDIRAACVPGAPARYRMVYNGNFDVQSRVYDLVRTAEGASLRTVVSPSKLTLVTYGSAYRNPWNPERESTVPLDLDTYSALARSLEADGFGAPTRTDIAFPSWDFYWIVTACAEGKFHINGWRLAAGAGPTLTFPDILLAHDKTEIPFADPVPNAFAAYRDQLSTPSDDRAFEVRLQPGGLFGIVTMF
jgi:hypothetical protein